VGRSQAQNWGPLPLSPSEEWDSSPGEVGRSGSYLQVTAAIRVLPKDGSSPASVPPMLYNLCNLLIFNRIPVHNISFQEHLYKEPPHTRNISSVPAEDKTSGTTTCYW